MQLSEHAISSYAASLDDPGGTAFRIILARDALARALAGSTDLTPEALTRIAELDERLQAQAATHTASIGRTALASWRKVMQPPENAWWWSLDTIADAASARTNPLWPILAAAFVTLSISLATEISLRFLSGGPDLVGLFSTFAQAGLALLAGSAFTRAGGEWIDRFLSRLQVGRKSRGAWNALLALAVLATIVALRLSLPAVARLYNDRGVLLQQDGKVTSARQHFERAIRLNPDYPQAHFNLAGALEESLDHGAALGAYQKAIKLDERMYPAYNNLARLYLQRGDEGSALTLLNAALKLAPPEPHVQYSLRKNRGWANFGLGYFLQAEEDLQQAIALRPKGGAAAHCLLAQVLEAQKKDAMTEWEGCIAYAPGELDEVEATWLGLAQERLLQVMQ